MTTTGVVAIISNMKTEIVSVQMPAQMLIKLKTLKKKGIHGSSVSAIIRKSVLLFLENHNNCCNK